MKKQWLHNDEALEINDIDYCTNMEAGKRCVGRDCVYVSRKEWS